VKELREDFRVLTIGGSAFGTPGYFRISITTREQSLTGCLEGFKTLADKYIK